MSDTSTELHIINIMPNADPFEQVVHQIKRRWADGYVLVSIHLNAEQYEQLHSYGVPIVLLDDYHPTLDTVTTDNVFGSYAATRRLVDLGALRIALIAGSPDSQPIQSRKTGYKKALEEVGLYDERFIFTGDLGYRDGFTERNGYDAMMKLLQHDPIPDACFCTSDVKGIGAMRAMRESGVRLPMICYDNLSISEYMGLSTIAQPMREMGCDAAKILMERIQDPDRPFAHTLHTPVLLERDTTLGFDGLHRELNGFGVNHVRIDAMQEAS